MALKRITRHPILEIPEKKEVPFTWNGNQLTGYEGEMISSALLANGIHIFGHHPGSNLQVAYKIFFSISLAGYGYAFRIVLGYQLGLLQCV